MQIHQIAIAGFKSFAEPISLDLREGLTAIVGPNGCGKSNLVEALSWVMGEGSSRHLRGEDMDDVIFAGNARRAARSLAQVTIQADVKEGLFAGTALSGSIEIRRAVERGKPTRYSLNRTHVRGRDLQRFFADQGTGASSACFVAQGRITALIAAKPADRRHLLEEAAGVAGFHDRRQETLTRIKAARENLARVTMVIEELEQQRRNLRNQARRGRFVRRLQGLHWRMTHTLIQQRCDRARAACMRTGRRLNKVRDERVHLVADLEAQQASLAQLQRDVQDSGHTRERAQEQLMAAAKKESELAAEQAQWTNTRQSAQERLNQTANQLAREQEIIDDAQKTLTGIQVTLAEMMAKQQAVDAQLTDAQETLDQAQARFREGQEILHTYEQDLARHRGSAESAKAEIDRLKQTLRALERQQQTLDAPETNSDADVQAAARELEKAEAAAAVAQDALTQARQQAEQGQDQATQATRVYQDLAAEQDRLLAQADGLASTLGAEGQSLADEMTDIPSELRLAVYAALGHEISASRDPQAQEYWQATDPEPLWSNSLADEVPHPPELARALGACRLVDDEQEAMQITLGPGQALVSRKGALWRWDGLRRRGVSERGQQWERLAKLRRQAGERKNRLTQAEENQQGAQTVAQAAQDAAHLAQQTHRQAQQDRDDAGRAHREALDERRRIQQEQDKRRQDAKELAAQIAYIRERIVDQESILALDAPARPAVDLDPLRQELRLAEGTLAQVQASDNRARIEGLHADREGWASRRDRAQDRLASLSEEQGCIEAQLAEIADRPEQLALAHERARTDLHQAQEQLEIAQQTAKQQQADSDQLQAQCAKRANEVAQADVQLARLEESLAAQTQEQERLAQDLADHQEEQPEDPAATLRQDVHSAPREEEILMLLERIDRRIEDVGNVNFAAQSELVALVARGDSLTRQRDDIEQALEGLTEALDEINSEARKRVYDVLEQLNKNFSELFQKVFSGGSARLALTETDDPLQAGLEVFACPPGKKVRTLSLLSGGEQTLTAIALLVATARLKPTPIWVLDEVDAALDDENIVNFCNLVRELAQSGDSRILIVTHNPITISKADHLVGVTMAERGVSSIISLNMAQAVELAGSQLSSVGA
ncbi:MAG: AAA family ATPase [Pseudomonadota bacterium]